MENRTVREAGWHLSRYNLRSRLPETGETVVVNLLARSIVKCSPIEIFLLDVAEELSESHPILPKFKRNGFLVNYDEKAAVDSLGRGTCVYSAHVDLTICPTLACNFDCSYCFEKKRPGKMTAEVQDQVVAFAERMLTAFRPESLGITWFGGEPLLAPEIIESLSRRMIALAESKGVAFSAKVITNGYLLDAEMTELLTRCRVKAAQITLDGVGPVNDATRPLLGGGGTFDRILANLTDHPIPFDVTVRQNIHRDNLNELKPLKALIREAAKKSGNRLIWFPDLALPNQATEDRGAQVSFVDRQKVFEADLFRISTILRNPGCYCLAQRLTDVAIDEQGRLYKCWESMDNPAWSFGTAARWDPRDVMNTTDNPDMLTSYLNTASPIPDQECDECVWLPLCRGGCPRMRLMGKRACIGFKDEKENFAAMIYRYKQENELL